MEKGIWISYDLGIQGDYSHLYAWLDNHDALECGDSLAYLKYTIPNEMEDAEFLDYLKKDLEQSVSFKPGDRIYVIRRIKNASGSNGKFILGSRKAAPWEGYGEKGGEENEDGNV